MGDSLQRLREQLQQTLSRFSGSQKVMLAVIGVAVLAMLLIFLVWTTSTPYESLYSGLSPKDAGVIIEKLKERNIDYQLANGGQTILVPGEKLYELRLELAQDGLPEAGPVGYEILDNQELGVTEFRQQIAYKRALEGELARTIRSIDVVENANVLIVLPKERLFRRDQEVPTASVQLKLKRRGMPAPMTIEAITHLVANGVEGLEPENVTITDTRGRILTESRDPNSSVAMSNTQLEFSRNVEQDLERKVLAVLEKRVGVGNASVQVTADLNWDQVEKTIQDVDPDGSVPVSEETNEQSMQSDGSGNPGSSSSNTITNYENTKTVQRIVEGVGNISQLSVAVMVNYRKETVTDANGNTSEEVVPRSADEMNQLEALVKSAVGFRQDRNDQLSIVNMAFDPSEQIEDFEEPGFYGLGSPWEILEKLVIVVVILLAAWIMRSILMQARQRNDEIQQRIRELRGETEEPAGALGGGREAAGALGDGAEGEEDEEPSEELIMADEFFKAAKQVNMLNEQVQNYIMQQPEVATRLIKVWLMEDEDA